MPQFSKVFNLFVDWHRTESRHKQNVAKVRKGSKFSSTKLDRTKQLGLPHTRTLMANKDLFINVLDERRIKCLESHLEMSLNTIYAKLLVEKQNQNNTEECLKNERKGKQRKMTKEEHKMWLMRMASPKRLFSNINEEEQEPESKKEVDYSRIRLLAKPKVRYNQEPTEINVTKSALEYNASENIKHLARPRWPRQKYVRSLITETPQISYRPNPAYKSIKSKGIKYLSLPQRKREKFLIAEEEVDNIVNDATSIPEANDYVCKLAQPKKFRENKIIVSAAYELENGGYILPVSRAALKYEATDHILKLSRPKRVRQMKENDPIIQKEKAMAKLANRWYYEHVSPAALKHEATPRVRNLAKPKICGEIEENDCKVKKSALRKVEKKKEKIYKNLATPLPRNCTPKFEIPTHAISHATS